MDLYHKATATQRCLPFKSSHQNVLKNNNVSGFHNIRLIQSNSDERCECCKYLLINDHYTFKNVQIKNPLLNWKPPSHAIVLTSYMSSSVTHVRRNVMEKQGKEKLTKKQSQSQSISPTHLASIIPTIKSQKTFKSMW